MSDVGTTTLADFLLARIAEDEAIARQVRPHEHLHWRDETDLVGADADAYATVGVTSGRVLAECESKRRIVARHAAHNSAAEWPWLDEDELASMTPEEIRGVCGWCTYDNRTVWSPCPDLRTLALPYADHPEYDEKWRP